jgi:hypothetical protein
LIITVNICLVLIVFFGAQRLYEQWTLHRDVTLRFMQATRDFSENPVGPDPQLLYWSEFWELGISAGSESRDGARLLGNALTMLYRLGRHEEVCRRSLSNEVGEIALLDSIDKSFVACGKAGLSDHFFQVLEYRISSIGLQHRQSIALSLARLLIESGDWDLASRWFERIEPDHLPAHLTELQRKTRYVLEHLRPGAPEPVFEALTVSGERLLSTDLRGTPHVLFFWSPRSGHSTRALQALEMEPLRGPVVISVVVGVDLPELEAVMRGRGQGMIHTGGGDGGTSQTVRAFAVSATPTFVVVNGEGRIVGMTHSPELMVELVRLMN